MNPFCETWETGNGDGSGIYLRQPGRAGHVKIGDFGEAGRAPGGSAAAVERAQLAATAPAMVNLLECMVRGSFTPDEWVAEARAILAKAGRLP